MSLIPFRTFLPYTNIVSRCYQNFFPNAMLARGNHFMTLKSMPPNPYERLYPGPGFHVPCQPRNTVLDKPFPTNYQPRLILTNQPTAALSNITKDPEVTKRVGRTYKNVSDIPLIRVNRRKRTIFTNKQLIEMEKFFSQCTYVGPREAEELATRLSLDIDPVKLWFKNRRVKQKRVQKREKNTTKATAAPKVVPNVPEFSPVSALPLSPTCVRYGNSVNNSFYAQATCSTNRAIGYQLPPPAMTSTPTQNTTNKVSTSIRPQQSYPHHYFQKQQLNVVPTTNPYLVVNFSDQSFTTTANNSGTSDYFSEMSSNSGTYNKTESRLDCIQDYLKASKKNPMTGYSSCRYN